MTGQHSSSQPAPSESPAALLAHSSPHAFRVQVQPVAGGQVRVSASGPAGTAEATVAEPDLLPLPDDPAIRWQAAARSGERLFAAAFPPPILRLLEESRHRVDDAALPIALTLAVDALAALPWEWLRDPESERFLALNPRVPLLRIPAGATPRPDRLPLAVDTLQVRIVAPAADESLSALAAAIGAHPRVEVIIAATPDPNLPSHVLHATGDAATAELGEDVPLMVVLNEQPLTATGPPRAVLSVPRSMPAERQMVFFSRWYAEIASGQSLEAATVAARRAVAETGGVTELTWALPVLFAPGAGITLMRPARRLGDAVGSHLREHSAGWLRDTLSGVVSSITVFLVGLLLFRVGFSTSPEFSFDIVSPWSLYQSFKGLILELSTYQEHFLLITAGILLVLTVSLGSLWLRNRTVAPDARRGAIWHVAGPLSSLRSVAFVGVATLVVVGAFAYQQYLWNVALPIPKQAIGFAITREAAAASFRDQFADVLYAQGQAERIVVRELPVRFDARDTAKARALGKRIGAQAVIIYRQDTGSDGHPQYIAYVVFTNPSVGLTVGTAPAPSSTQAGGPSPPSPAVQLREGVEIPALRTDNLTELVNAAAGMIAWHENRAREAISLLEQALPRDRDAPNTGIINFFLGAAYHTADDDQRAAQALERAAGFFERRQQAGWVLGPQDLLILTKTYLLRGQVEVMLIDDPTSAIGWLHKAVALREATVARSGSLERPVDVHGTFARVFAELANLYRALDQPDEQAHWETRADEELALLASSVDPRDTAAAVQEAGARFFAGDCAGALSALDRALSVDPSNVDALTSAGIVALFQGRGDQAVTRWQASLAVRPDDIVTLQTLSALEGQRGLGGDLGSYVEIAYLIRAEERLRQILAIDPVNLQAYRDLANYAWFRAQATISDSSALQGGDLFTFAKSQQLWPKDRQRRDSAAEALGDAIEARRIIASELRREDPAAWAALALAYEARANVIYDSLNALYGFPVANPHDAQFLADGERILADTAQVHDWAGRVLAGGSGASRLDRLEAHAALVEALEWEWSWLYFFAADKSQLDQKADEFVAALDAAVADIETQPVNTVEEIGPARTIYFVARFVALITGNDQLASQYQAKITGLTAREQALMQSAIVHDATYCREERFRLQGDAALAHGDLPGARTAFEAALSTNPGHIPSLRGLAIVLLRQGDVPGAQDRLTHAGEISPNDPRVWASLGLARLAAGDMTGGDAAYARFFALIAALPAQEQLAYVRLAFGDLQAFIDQVPGGAEAVRALLPALIQKLDAMPPAFVQTFQYPQAYERLGTLALLAGDPAAAEALARHAVAIDPHLPTAQATIVLAVLSQDRDATTDLATLAAELRNPFWQGGSDPTEDTALDMISAQVQRFLTQFPDRTPAIQPLLDLVIAERGRLTAG